MNALQVISQGFALVSRSATLTAAYSGLINPEKFLGDVFSPFGLYGAQDSGVAVTSKSIQQIPAYISGLRLLAETMGSLSGKMIRETDSSIESLKTDPRFRLVFRQPSQALTSPVFWETVTKYAVHKGNAFALIVRNPNTFQPQELIFVHEKLTVEVYHYENRLWYRVPQISNEMIPDYNMLHFKGLGDGHVGIGAIEYAATSAGVTLATQKNQAKFFKSGSKLQGYISHPKQLKKETLQKLRESWHEVYHTEGSSNSTAFLDEGMEYKTISVTPEAAKYLETLKNGYYDIAAILRVPPHMIGQMDKSSFNNIEHQSIDFVKFSLLPWIHRFEAELWSKLLTEKEKIADEIKFKFNVDSLLRGTYRDRMEGYRIAINTGLLSQNEARKLESLAPFPGGDERWIQMNMMPLSKADDILNRTADQLQLTAIKTNTTDGKSAD